MDAFLTDLQLTPPLILTLILGLVEFAKRAGLTGRASLYLSLALGVLLGGGYLVATRGLPSDPAAIFTTLVTGLTYGLAASGIFDLAQRFLPPAAPSEDGQG